MKAHIITIGDELLIGQATDTNSTFISKALNSIGMEVYQRITVADDKSQLIDTFKSVALEGGVILMTGGLGPTRDDVTKHAICEFFEDKLEINQQVLEQVKQFFILKNRPFTQRNKDQALVPSSSEIIENKIGTAPGMWFEKDGFILISMPGVPSEMKLMVDQIILPKLKQKFNLPHIIHSTLNVLGLPESILADRIEQWEDKLPKNIKLAYLPSFGKVRLRISGKSDDKILLENQIQKEIESLRTVIGQHIVGDDGELIEQVIGDLMKDKNQTLSLAESCTGGAISERITSVSGASKYFLGAIVPYSTDKKQTILGINSKIINTHSVVSKEVAREMAKNAREMFGSDYAIATTGNAGPTKGHSQANIGRVYIAVAYSSKVLVNEYNFIGNREMVIKKTVNKSQELLYKLLLDKSTK